MPHFESYEDVVAYQKKLELEGEALQADVDRWFAEATAHDLFILSLIMRHVQRHKNSAFYYNGQAVSLMRVVHNVDPETGKPFGSEFTIDDFEKTPDPEPVGLDAQRMDEFNVTEYPDVIAPDPNEPTRNTDLHQRVLSILKLAPVPEKPFAVACTNCGLEYPSFEDRTLKEECHGCHLKERQGSI